MGRGIRATPIASSDAVVRYAPRATECDSAACPAAFCRARRRRYTWPRCAARPHISCSTTIGVHGRPTAGAEPGRAHDCSRRIRRRLDARRCRLLGQPSHSHPAHPTRCWADGISSSSAARRRRHRGSRWNAPARRRSWASSWGRAAARARSARSSSPTARSASPSRRSGTAIPATSRSRDASRAIASPDR